MQEPTETILRFFRRLIPERLFIIFQPYYHKILSGFASMLYRRPSKNLIVIGVTGTNGKSTTVEFLSEILTEAGYRVASTSSIRFRIHDREKTNTAKMTMPGRFTLQKFLRSAVRAGCTHAVLEVTSQGIRQFRHANIDFTIAVITNITPEHIESHGSFEEYRKAKAELFALAPIHVLNKDDKETYDHFLRIPADERHVYSVLDIPKKLHLKIPGEFNKENAMAALTAARVLGVDDKVSMRALSQITYIPGRLEIIQEEPFGVVVDYAHTPDALEKVYESFDVGTHKLICVLGSTGGGRDTWKRPEHGRIAAEHCNSIFLTDEDSYDEPLDHILKDVERGFYKAPSLQTKKLHYEKISDRKKAIEKAIMSAQKGDVVIITGKGSESVMMGPDGTRIPHDDREVVRTILAQRKKNHGNGKGGLSHTA